MLGANVQTGLGELDLIARRGDLVIFCEVKARSSAPELLACSISQAQRRRIENAARLYLASRRLEALDARFDAILVDLSGSEPRLEWIEGAFEALF